MLGLSLDRILSRRDILISQRNGQRLLRREQRRREYERQLSLAEDLTPVVEALDLKCVVETLWSWEREQAYDDDRTEPIVMWVKVYPTTWYGLVDRREKPVLDARLSPNLEGIFVNNAYYDDRQKATQEIERILSEYLPES